MIVDPGRLRLCLVTDRNLSRGRPLVEIVAAAVRGGATMAQLREKDADTRAFVELARALKTMLAEAGVAFIVNDRVDIALAVDADGVHVGQSDMRVEDVRRLLGPDRIVGLSIDNVDQIRRGDAECADYLGVGPIYAQSTKIDAAPPLGVAGLRAARALSTRPIIAIGGITPDNAAAVLEAGAQGLAVVSAIVSADDPEAATRRLAQLIF